MSLASLGMAHGISQQIHNNWNHHQDQGNSRCVAIENRSERVIWHCERNEAKGNNLCCPDDYDDK